MAIQKVKLSVEGLHCKNCADNLMNVVSLIRGVKKASVDYATKKLESIFDDDHVSRERLAREITSVGYRVV